MVPRDPALRPKREFAEECYGMFRKAGVGLLNGLTPPGALFKLSLRTFNSGSSC